MKLSRTYRPVVAISVVYFPETQTGAYHWKTVCREQNTLQLSSAVCSIGIVFVVST